MLIDAVVPGELHQVDFARMIFVLEFREACSLDAAALLGFRSMMRPVARQVFADAGADGKRRYKTLFEPEFGHDPVALKKFQKPSPAFVLSLREGQSRVVHAGERLELDVLFVGSSTSLIGDFTACLILLGRFGLVGGYGKYEVVGLSALGQDDQAQGLWQHGDEISRIAPPIDTLDLWLERRLPVDLPVTLKFEMPTRLLVSGRPLRRPSFAALFPFMLRRVTSMLYAHAGCELVHDAAELLRVAETVQVAESHFCWSDWRDLSGRRPIRAIGGFTGGMSLQGGDLGEIFWVIALASLFGLGKGAAYGAGRLRLAGW